MQKTFKKMEKSVAKYLKKQKLSNKNIDIVEFANELGFEVRFGKFTNDKIQFLMNKTNDNKYLIINKKMSYHKSRFAIALAIAYYLLNLNDKEDFLIEWLLGTTNIVSKEVFCFAMILLVNKIQFIDRYEELLTYETNKDYILESLSCYFSTPKEIISIVLLNYIPQNKKTTS